MFNILRLHYILANISSKFSMNFEYKILNYYYFCKLIFQLSAIT